MDETIVDNIIQNFKNAKPLNDVISDCSKRLETDFDLDLSKIISAISVCPDELNNAFIESVKNVFGEPFHLSGLSGYPFTGVTGFNAFGDHIPDGGSAVILFGSHIGISNHTWGHVKRMGQERETLSCGAVLTAYQSLLDGGKCFDETLDFQQAQVQKMIERELPTIDHSQKEKQLAHLILRNSHSFIKQQAQRIKKQFNAHKIVLVGGIIINTPSTLSDYLSIEIVEEV